MAEGRLRSEWEQAAAIMAAIARSVGNKRAKPNDFNPFARRDAEGSLSMADIQAPFRRAAAK